MFEVHLWGFHIAYTKEVSVSLVQHLRPSLLNQSANNIVLAGTGIRERAAKVTEPLSKHSTYRLFWSFMEAHNMLAWASGYRGYESPAFEYNDSVIVSAWLRDQTVLLDRALWTYPKPRFGQIGGLPLNTLFVRFMGSEIYASVTPASTLFRTSHSCPRSPGKVQQRSRN